jgi:hypothetical protein
MMYAGKRGAVAMQAAWPGMSPRMSCYDFCRQTMPGASVEAIAKCAAKCMEGERELTSKPPPPPSPQRRPPGLVGVGQRRIAVSKRAARHRKTIVRIANDKEAARRRVASRILALGRVPAVPIAACDYNPNKLKCAKGTIPRPSAATDAHGRRLWCCMPAPITSKLPRG